MWDEMEPGWDGGAAWEQPRTDVTVVRDIAQGSEAVDSAGLNSFWSGLGSTLGKVLDYGIQRDAAKTGVELSIQRQQAAMYPPQQPLAPLYGRTAGGALGINPTALLLIGGLVVGGVLLTRK